MTGVLAFLRSRWFLIALVVLIPTGFLVGRADHSGEISRGLVTAIVKPVVMTVLFLMSVTLDSRQLLASLSKPKPVLWACAGSVFVVPLIAWPVSLWQSCPDFRVGLMIAASVPCTMAAASVWTRRADGNDAVSLLTTLLTNGLCFIYTPWLLALLAGQNVTLDVGDMAVRLAITALLPAIVGQIVRWIAVKFFDLDRLKTFLGVLAQLGILVIVFGASAKAGPALTGLGNGGSSQTVGVVVMAASCLFVHLTAAWVAWTGAKTLGIARNDAIACLFAGSQKTLPIGLLIATDPTMLGGVSLPLAAFPMLTFHMLQLFADTLIADRLKQHSEHGTSVP